MVGCTTCHQQFQIPDLNLAGKDPVIPLRPSLEGFDRGPGGCNRAGFILAYLFTSSFFILSSLALSSKADQGLAREAILVLDLIIHGISLVILLSAFWFRLKNMSVSTVWTLTILVPYLNIVAMILLLILPS